MSSKNVIVKNNLVYLNVSGMWCVYDSKKEPLGAGAMGTVYYGFLRDSNIPVAIKKVKDEYSNDKNIRNRARQEASLKFRHRNLIEMIGLCEWDSDNGPIFIVSKYVHGDTLDNFVQQKLCHLSNIKRSKTICNMIMPIFDALSYLHANNILHMDIKPSNIMVENGSNIRLMDLGIANTEAYKLANTSNMMGTPKYAAPEQFGHMGTNEGIDTRSDIYELSVTIYELLSNNNPFLSNTFGELVEKHKTLLLPYHPSIPKTIMEVLRKAAHPNKQMRYNNIADFRYAFKNAIFMLDDNHEEGSKKWVALVVSLFLLLIGFFIFYMIML